MNYFTGMTYPTERFDFDSMTQIEEIGDDVEPSQWINIKVDPPMKAKFVVFFKATSTGGDEAINIDFIEIFSK